MTDTRYNATDHYFPHERLMAYQLAEEALVFVAALDPRHDAPRKQRYESSGWRLQGE